MTATREQVWAAIERERAYQDKKWGTLDAHPHQFGAWLAILRRELREALDAWCSAHGDAGALEELLQVASVAFACLTQHADELLLGAIRQVEWDGERVEWEVGSWITALEQALRVAEAMWLQGPVAQVMRNGRIETDSLYPRNLVICRILAGCIICMTQHGIVERAQLQSQARPLTPPPEGEAVPESASFTQGFIRYRELIPRPLIRIIEHDLQGGSGPGVLGQLSWGMFLTALRSSDADQVLRSAGLSAARVGQLQLILLGEAFMPEAK